MAVTNPSATGAILDLIGGPMNCRIAALLAALGAVVAAAQQPVVDFASYIGGSCCNNDWVNAVATDAEGYIYLTGHAGSKDFPTVSAIQSSCSLGSLGSCNDAFVVKLDPSGQRIIYSTYFGGSRVEEGLAIAADKEGRAYVAGTYVDNAGFIVILDRDGRLVAEKLIFTAPQTLTIPRAIAIDPDGNALVAGVTFSDRLSLVNPVQSQAGPPSCQSIGGTAVRFTVDAWVGKFSGDYLYTRFLTYLGGSGNDEATAIAADAAGYIYVAGGTSSRDFPLANAYQAQNRSLVEPSATSCDTTELFLTKIDPFTPRIVYSTYFGGANVDGSARLAVDPAGYAYLGGSSGSNDWTVPGMTGPGGPSFLLKVSPGGQLRYGRWLGMLGAAQGIAVAGIALQPTGQAWMSAAAIGGVQPGGAPLAAFQGPGGQINALAAGAGGALILAGLAGGSWGPVQTVRAFQPNLAGSWSGALNGFVARYLPNTQPDCRQAYAVNGASYRGPEASPASIIALFGCGFSDTTEAASSPRLSDTLADIRVFLSSDSVGPVAAALYAVTPNQINFVVPDGLPPGNYKAVVRRGSAVVASASVGVAAAPPALFPAAASGEGPPAAWALRVAADGRQTLAPVADCSSGACQSVAIEPPADGERIFLLLFGTGIRGRSSTENVSATIGGKKLSVMAAVAQSEYPGLDQVNVELPRELAGAGAADLLITVDGANSNRVKLLLR
ncbi:MAG: SBBP repeat-containing protein [Methanothrix sp.]|nr:SBBP repeat-containing protein [Methanothrix sp.]